MPNPAARRRLLALTTAFAAAQGQSAAVADDLTYQGGAWNAGSSWSTGNVPTEFDYLRFPVNGAPNQVQLNGGGVAYELYFEGGEGSYELLSEAGGRLRTAHIINDGSDQTKISVGQLTGLQIDQDTSRLVIEGSSETTINSIIVDDQGRTTDVWLRAIVKNLTTHSGATHVLGNTKLIDGGAFLLSNSVVIERSTLILDNSGDSENGNRISNSATVSLSGSPIILQGSGHDAVANRERIGSVALGAGGSRVDMYGGASLIALGTGQGIQRDNNARGTIVVNDYGDGAFITNPSGRIDGTVPYAIYSDNGEASPAVYDPGVDGAFGNTDDIGFRRPDISVVETNINLAGTAEHVYVSGNQTLNTSLTFRTLSVYDDATLDLGAATASLSDGVVLLDTGNLGTTDAAKITGSPNAILTTSPGRELFVYGGGPNNEIAVQISGTDGLTYSPRDGSIFSNARLILSRANSYGGPTTVNGGILALRTQQALPVSSILKLVESSIEFDYAGSIVPNRIIFDNGTATPFGGGSFIRDIRLKDGQTFSFTGSFEGRGAFFTSGNGSTMKIDTSVAVTALTPGEFSLWPRAGSKLQVDGRLGDGIQTFGTVILFEGSLSGNGRLTGGFQLSGGDFRPGPNGGTGVGLFRVRDCGLYEGAAFFQVNGNQRGITYDALDVDQGCFTNEHTTFTVQGSYNAPVGTRLDLIHYGSHFSFGPTPTTVINPLPKPANANWIYYYDADSLTIALAGPAGDATIDGAVNFQDLVILAQNYGQMGTNYTTGDFNNDGTTDFADLVSLAQHYNTSALSGDIVPASEQDFAADWALAQSLAPEPATLLAAAGVVSMTGRRRRAN
jgi:autotransporter-associated beta strand protein